MMDDNLKFDSVIMENLVEIYSLKYNREFKPIFPDERQATKNKADLYNNKIFYFDDTQVLNASTDRSDQSKVLKNIAQKVKENAELFAQIEAKMRNMEAAKVKEYDVELIVKEFEYYSELGSAAVVGSKNDRFKDFEFKPNMPLCACALLARYLYQNDSVHITSNDVNCAMALHLFVQICLEAGYPTTCIAWSFKPGVSLISSRRIGSTGSTAVVTRTADIESAIACLLDASQDFRYPWCLRQIFVQESVFADFKQALVRNTEIDTQHEQLAARSASARSRGEKTFLVEYAGPTADILDSESLALVAAYRTTSELFKLLHSFPPAYLSLWSSDNSVSNEIAFGVHCGVWLNNFAWLKGPHRYCHSGDMIDQLAILDWLVENKIGADDSELNKMVSHRTEWLKTDVEKRRQKVIEVLRGSSSDSTKLIDDLIKWEPKSFVRVEKGTLYQGFEEARGVIVCVLKNVFETLSIECFNTYLSEMIRSVVSGNGLLLFGEADKNTCDIIENLYKAHVPVMRSKISLEAWSNGKKEPDGIWISTQPFDANLRGIFKTRVVTSHFGETFAN